MIDFDDILFFVWLLVSVVAILVVLAFLAPWLVFLIIGAALWGSFFLLRDLAGSPLQMVYATVWVVAFALWGFIPLATVDLALAGLFVGTCWATFGVYLFRRFLRQRAIGKVAEEERSARG